MPSQLKIGPSYESNPYQPTAPNGPDTFDFLNDLTVNLRAQHNKIQAGDSSTPWQMLNELTQKPLNTPGSQGKFVHPVYGIIAATYVEFKNPVAGIWTGVPVGFLAPSTLGFAWEVTTDLAKSAATRLVGLQAAFSIPQDGDYGWAITEGVNTQSVNYQGDKPELNQSLGWAQTGFAGQGTGLGILTTIEGLAQVHGFWEIPPAAIHIGG